MEEMTVSPSWTARKPEREAEEEDVAPGLGEGDVRGEGLVDGHAREGLDLQQREVHALMRLVE